MAARGKHELLARGKSHNGIFETPGFGGSKLVLLSVRNVAGFYIILLPERTVSNLHGAKTKATP